MYENEQILSRMITYAKQENKEKKCNCLKAWSAFWGENLEEVVGGGVEGGVVTAWKKQSKAVKELMAWFQKWECMTAKFWGLFFSSICQRTSFA